MNSSSALLVLAAFACLAVAVADHAHASDDNAKSRKATASRPANVDDDAHAWLEANLGSAMPFLLQTALGPIEPEHIAVVDELGNWGAGRAKGKHQGTDFVLDLPHTAGSDRVLVGNVIAGRVVHLEKGWGSYGNTVFVHRENDPQLVVVYAHLASIDVAIGDTLQVGDILGNFGCTGNCTGLSGHHVRNQVHVELYAMPDDFTPASIKWDEMPMRQLRATAIQTKPRKTDGVDVAHYFGDFKLAPVTRAELGERYARNKDAGGLATYLANADAERLVALAASAPRQDGLRDDDHTASPATTSEVATADASTARETSDAHPANDASHPVVSDPSDIVGAAALLTARLDALEFGRRTLGHVPGGVRGATRRAFATAAFLVAP